MLARPGRSRCVQLVPGTRRGRGWREGVKSREQQKGEEEAGWGEGSGKGTVGRAPGGPGVWGITRLLTPDSPPRPASHAAPAASGLNMELGPAGGREAMPGSVVVQKRGLSGTDSRLRAGSEATPESRENRAGARSVKGSLSRNHSDAKAPAASSGEGGLDRR